MDKTRRHVESHPWIKFSSIDIGQKNWFLLGAAESKCKHMANIPLPPQAMQKLLHVSMSKGFQATTAIEGNTLSLEDVGRIMDNKLDDFAPSQKYQVSEVQNVINAYNHIARNIDGEAFSRVTPEQIKDDNKTILQNLDLKPEVVPGEIRTHSVVVSRYRGAPAEDCQYLLSELCEWLNSDWGLEKHNIIAEGILKAILGHLYIAWIHPFGDGNGRTARMLELRLLMATGVPMNAAHLLSNYYNDTRAEYYLALDRSVQGGGDGIRKFIGYALQGFVDALDVQIKLILSEQRDLIWENYVHKIFENKKTAARERQKGLLLDISKQNEAVSLKTLRMRLSDKILLLYKGKTEKTFVRDINDLLKEELLIKVEDTIAANKEKLRSFLPIRKSV